MSEERKEYIDVTPTWTGILPWLLHVMKEGDSEGRQFAADELLRAAGLLDHFIEKYHKAPTPNPKKMVRAGDERANAPTGAQLPDQDMLMYVNTKGDSVVAWYFDEESDIPHHDQIAEIFQEQPRHVPKGKKAKKRKVK